MSLTFILQVLPLRKGSEPGAVPATRDITKSSGNVTAIFAKSLGSSSPTADTTPGKSTNLKFGTVQCKISISNSTSETLADLGFLCLDTLSFLSGFYPKITLKQVKEFLSLNPIHQVFQKPTQQNMHHVYMAKSDVIKQI